MEQVVCKSALTYFDSFIVWPLDICILTFDRSVCDVSKIFEYAPSVSAMVRSENGDGNLVTI